MKSLQQQYKIHADEIVTLIIELAEGDSQMTINGEDSNTNKIVSKIKIAIKKAKKKLEKMESLNKHYQDISLQNQINQSKLDLEKVIQDIQALGTFAELEEEESLFVYDGTQQQLYSMLLVLALAYLISFHFQYTTYL